MNGDESTTDSAHVVKIASAMRSLSEAEPVPNSKAQEPAQDDERALRRKFRKEALAAGIAVDFRDRA